MTSYYFSRAFVICSTYKRKIVKSKTLPYITRTVYIRTHQCDILSTTFFFYRKNKNSYGLSYHITRQKYCTTKTK